jgi:hypothetical protein
VNAASQQLACIVSASRRSNTAHEQREHVGLYLDCPEDLIQHDVPIERRARKNTTPGECRDELDSAAPEEA